MLKITDVALQAENPLDVFSVSLFLSFSDLTLLMYSKLQLPFLLKYLKDVDMIDARKACRWKALLLMLFSRSRSCVGYREGFLWKRGRDNGQFLSRKFILSEREGALKYFNKQDVSLYVSHTHTCTHLHEEFMLDLYRIKYIWWTLD